MEWAGHADVGEECRSSRQDGLISSGNVRVSSHYSRNAAIKVPTHCDFLRRCFTMHVHKNDLDVLGEFRQFRIGNSKRIVGWRHEYTTLKIEDSHLFTRSYFYDSDALSGIICRIICGPQQSCIPVEVGHDFFLVPDVITRREDIYSPIEKLISNLRRDTKTRSCVLAIQNGEIDLILFLQIS